MGWYSFIDDLFLEDVQLFLFLSLLEERRIQLVVMGEYLLLLYWFRILVLWFQFSDNGVLIIIILVHLLFLFPHSFYLLNIHYLLYLFKRNLLFLFEKVIDAMNYSLIFLFTLIFASNRNNKINYINSYMPTFNYKLNIWLI